MLTKRLIIALVSLFLSLSRSQQVWYAVVPLGPNRRSNLPEQFQGEILSLYDGWDYQDDQNGPQSYWIDKTNSRFRYDTVLIYVLISYLESKFFFTKLSFSLICR